MGLEVVKRYSFNGREDSLFQGCDMGEEMCIRGRVNGAVKWFREMIREMGKMVVKCLLPGT